MRKLCIILLCLFYYTFGFAQTDLPQVKIKTLNGAEVGFAQLSANKDTALIVSFWATWCIPCITELETINDQLQERQLQTPFKLIAVSVDDTRSSARVPSFVKGRGWNFPIYLDTNSDLKRALNINDIPHILIIKNGKIIYQHTGYVPGNEEELFEVISKQ
ncbi:TlpA family protein disulfide reductase [Lacibacter sediminis]|uniref:TlpA family protein disulfide reductase n=1 Tax=Lacibacter sediminis TaxID=2760713 RepID=A0A7G5XH84_9BACT|nr:TlpA disulfide reductase family protein [Lacibacter sediminis]QNA44837.1 TlpA family protein disulfide reductase [Lacibacter sediminis]